MWTSYRGEVHLKFTNLECDPSPKYFHNCSCRLKAVNRYKTVSFMKTFIKDVLRNISVNIVLYNRNDVKVYRPYLVNVTQNVCEFLDKRKSNFYMNIFMKFLSQYSNVNHSCPYRGYLIMDNVYVDESHDSYRGEVHLKFTNLECDPSPKYFHNCSCRLKAVNRYKTVSFMKTFIKDVLRNIS
ncbi:uncharacterized protein LOC133331217, partial [Musca vetustissima]|uniref:uncharacterized protein LOC133331217 n=1 Tax=Musca vetustissima TaxID=27455 RepID=UPI002AB7339F